MSIADLDDVSADWANEEFEDEGSDEDAGNSAESDIDTLMNDGRKFADDALGIYFRDIAQFTLLTPQQEIQLGREIWQQRNAFEYILLRNAAVQQRMWSLINGNMRIDHLYDIPPNQKKKKAQSKKTAELSKREKVTSALALHRKTLGHLLQESQTLFRAIIRSDTDTKERHLLGVRHARVRAKIARLLKELTFRHKHISPHMKYLQEKKAQLQNLSATQEKTPDTKEAWRQLILELQESPSALGRRLSDAAKHEHAYHEAKSRLVNGNLRLVVNIAKKYNRPESMHLLDLIQEGNDGLMVTADKFDYRLGFRFTTYATGWIHQRIKRALANHSDLIHLPPDVKEMKRTIFKVTAHLWMTLQRRPSPGEIASVMGISDMELADLLKYTIEPYSIDSDMGTAYDDEPSFANQILDEHPADTGGAMTSDELHQKMTSSLEILSERERKIMQYRFGLLGEETKTLEETGDIFNVTKERIRQIEARGCYRLFSNPDIRESLESFLD